jgi:putative tryptophan/tyrosine transport system substrate-binding protein
MRRREFIGLLGGAAGWPLTARAQQQERMRRVGVLMGFAESDPESQANVTAFRQEIERRNWVHGRNIHIDYRWGDADLAQTRKYALELLGYHPDVILASTALVLLQLQQQTNNVPIVFAQVSDPVQGGFIASLSRPGGNITGFAASEVSVYGKSLGLLKEVAPYVRRVAVILSLQQTNHAAMLRVIETAAPSFGIQVIAVSDRDTSDIERAVDTFARDSDRGLIVLPSARTRFHRAFIIALAAQHRLPAVFAYRHDVISGGLVSYGVDSNDQYRRAGEYVARVLQGEKPADLPVQHPARYELVINLKTAKALGLDIPSNLLARADEVIE